MSKIIDFAERRNAAERPDTECIRKDDFGRPLYLFALSYQMLDGEFAMNVWAYSFEDAEARVEAMRESLVVIGQTHSIIPA